MQVSKVLISYIADSFPASPSGMLGGLNIKATPLVQYRLIAFLGRTTRGFLYDYPYCSYPIMLVSCQCLNIQIMIKQLTVADIPALNNQYRIISSMLSAPAPLSVWCMGAHVTIGPDSPYYRRIKDILSDLGCDIANDMLIAKGV